MWIQRAVSHSSQSSTTGVNKGFKELCPFRNVSLSMRAHASLTRARYAMMNTPMMGSHLLTIESIISLCVAKKGRRHDWPATRKRQERNVLFNDARNTFYLRLYGVRHMVKDHSDSEKGNLLPPHRLLLSINSKGSFICTVPQTG